MSKSNIATSIEPRVEVLLFEHGTASGHQRVPMHTHPFWQFEVIRTGRADCNLAGTKLRLKAGDLLLIPPETPHDFTYLRPSCAYISIKFDLTTRSAVPSKPLPPTAATLALRHALPFLAKSPDSLKTIHAILRHLLTALFIERGSSLSDDANSDFLIHRARQLIAASQGRKITVADLANRLGISAGYLAARFRAGEKTSLKSYLDKQRADRAIDLLRYSDLSISRIAETLEFPDPFTFSRFMSRHAGLSPRHLIKQRCRGGGFANSASHDNVRVACAPSDERRRKSSTHPEIRTSWPPA